MLEGDDKSSRSLRRGAACRRRGSGERLFNAIDIGGFDRDLAALINGWRIPTSCAAVSGLPEIVAVMFVLLLSPTL